MDNNLRKALELICAAFKLDATDTSPSIYNVSIPEAAFLRQGMSIDAGVAALKSAMQTMEYGILNVGDIYAASVENLDLPEHDGELVVCVVADSSLCTELYKSNMKQSVSIPTFSYKDSILTINGKQISFGTPDAKLNGAYILEHIFSHDLNEASDYIDVHTDTFGERKNSFKSKRYYDASEVINKRVSKEANIQEFLIANSRSDGSVRINPRYLP
jgi:hypothetical protein